MAVSPRADGRRRWLSGALAAVAVAFSVLVVTAPPAGAAPTQTEVCGDGTSDYPPTTAPGSDEPLVLVSVRLRPGARGAATVSGAVAGVQYCGTISSPTITLPMTAANGAGRIRFDGFRVPDDFETDAMHEIEVYNEHGSLVLDARFCVTDAGVLGDDCDEAMPGGAVATPSSPRADSAAVESLAFTGSEIWAVVRAALVLIALGVLAVYVRRRRELQSLRG